MVYQCLDCTEPEQSAYCRMLCDGQHPPQRLTEEVMEAAADAQDEAYHEYRNR